MKLYPKHISIEVVAGLCTCRCIMCTIGDFNRKKEIMTNDTFEKLIEKIKPYYEHIATISMVGFGETLLDTHIDDKIKELRDSGCDANIAITTNCTNLNASMSKKLLLADLDLIICSIDGATKQTHEQIRVGSDFDQIRSNLLGFIKLRDELKKKTRILLRFIKQKRNSHEAKDFEEYWNNHLNKAYGDEITIHNVHNFGGSLADFNDISGNGNESNNKDVTKKEPVNFCKEISLAMMIFADGTVPLCCGDCNADFAKSKNIFECSLEEVYNTEQRIFIRNMIEKGKIRDIPYCAGCSIPESAEKTGRNVREYYKKSMRK